MSHEEHPKPAAAEQPAGDGETAPPSVVLEGEKMVSKGGDAVLETVVADTLAKPLKGALEGPASAVTSALGRTLEGVAGFVVGKKKQ